MENPKNLNRRNFLKGISAVGALSIIGESAKADGYLDVEQAQDDEKFSMHAYCIYYGFSLKFNEENPGCPIEPKKVFK